MEAGVEVSNDNPTVSVIVPVYNAEAHLNQCVESIVNQTYAAWELLLVDDGSTDSSSAVCNSWAARDSRVRVIHKANGGVSSARNAGLDAAQGDYVLFIDSDDWIDAMAIEKGVNACATYGLDMFMMGHCKVDYSGVRYAAGCDPMVVRIDRTEFGSSEFFHDVAVLDNANYLFSCWGKLYRRAWAGTVRFPGGISYGEDTAFVFSLLELRGTIMADDDDSMYCYRIGDGLGEGFREHKGLDLIRLHEMYVRFYGFPELNDSDADLVTLRMTNQALWMLSSVFRVPTDVSIDQQENYVKEIASSPFRRTYLRGLRKAYVGRVLKLLFLCNCRWLWRMYLMRRNGR